MIQLTHFWQRPRTVFSNVIKIFFLPDKSIKSKNIYKICFSNHVKMCQSHVRTMSPIFRSRPKQKIILEYVITVSYTITACKFGFLRLQPITLRIGVGFINFCLQPELLGLARNFTYLYPILICLFVPSLFRQILLSHYFNLQKC